MDLISTQKSMKQIRNPFCDIVIKWDSKPFLLKKSNEPVTLIGRLADHCAWHLYQKVVNQYHDEQVAKLRSEGKGEREVRKFHVPKAVDNKIWILITGEPRTQEDPALLEQEAADLTVLQKSMGKMETLAIKADEVTSISSLLEQANTEALETVQSAPVDKPADHVGGSAKVNLNLPEPVAETIPTEEFAGLQSLG